MSKKADRAREQGTRCSLMPGERFSSRTEADDMRVTRQINVANGGMGQVVYHVQKCACGGHHLMTDEHFRRWSTKRRASRRARERDA